MSPAFPPFFVIEDFSVNVICRFSYSELGENELYKSTISGMMLILLSASVATLIVNTQRTRAAGGGISLRVVDSATGEELNEIGVKALWGSNFDEQSICTTHYGCASFGVGVNYTGDVLISTIDEHERYFPQSKLVHVSFTQWVNTSAHVEIRLDRVTPLQSSYEGDYIVSFLKDREVVYYGELAYLVVGVKSPYDGEFGLGINDFSFARVYGGGWWYLESDEITNITLRIEHSGHLHWDKTGNFTLCFSNPYRTLEEANFTLTFKRNWGYEKYDLRVRVIDAETKGELSGISVRACWGSSFNHFEYQSTSYGIVIFDLGAYPDGDVKIKAYDNAGRYSTEFKEVTMTENPTTVTIEVERTDEGNQPRNPIPYNLWILAGLIIVLVVVIGSLTIHKRRTSQKD